MRLRRRRPKEIKESSDKAVVAREEATSRLAETKDLLEAQAARARYERATIIAAVRKIREQDNLAGLILDDIERGSGGEPGTGSS
jgi:hypothetical protein